MKIEREVLVKCPFFWGASSECHFADDLQPADLPLAGSFMDLQRQSLAFAGHLAMRFARYGHWSVRCTAGPLLVPRTPRTGQDVFRDAHHADLTASSRQQMLEHPFKPKFFAMHNGIPRFYFFAKLRMKLLFFRSTKCAK